MKLSHVARSARKLGRGVGRVEGLERRMLLSATLVQAFPNISATPDSAPTTVDVSTHFTDPSITGTTVLVQTVNGNIPMELFDTVTPLTVTNFLHYVDNGLYNNTIIHRAPAGFVDQGGGYDTTGTHIFQGPAVTNEFHLSNTIGTVAMAKLGSDPNSATSEWFINVADNAANLDNQNGGFTVFGQVLYNGLSVAEAINALPKSPTGGPGSLAGASDVPIENASGDTSPSNLVVVSSVARVPSMTFNAVSSNTALVSPSLNGNTLSLNYGAGKSGIAYVTVSGTDLGGNVAQQTFRVVVPAAAGNTLPVTIGAGGAKAVTFTDPVSHSTGTISLKGPGSAAVTFAGTGLTQAAGASGITVTGPSGDLNVESINVTGSTLGSTLVFTTKGGSQKVSVGDINVTGSLGALTGKGVDVAGDFTSSGPVKTILIDGARNGTFTIGAGAAALSITANSGTTDETLTSANPITSLNANNWDSSATAAATITAPRIASIHTHAAFGVNLTLTGGGTALGAFKASVIREGAWTVTGNVGSVQAGGSLSWTPTISGNLKSLKLSGTSSVALVAGSVSSFNVHGALQDSAVTVNGAGADLGKFVVSGAVTGTSIKVAGNIASIQAESISNSLVYAGVNTLASGQTLPSALTDFSTAASIGSISLTAKKGTAAFVNSDVAAEHLGKLSLGVVATSNGGSQFGVAGHTIAAVTGTDRSTQKKIALKNVTQTVTLTDFVVKAV
ncbi:MAG TPA: peptidylprolyl isomerase [Tepidisphaeraceae bacterium]|jgi:cyclophilin family peptidyl-prolyl cis-trans isomerase|nr:peptidylprolyl isomerase [Tepidisphaeraceae bacterium]